jgi:ABC-type polar amino acid transport system ATPase subunit
MNSNRTNEKLVPYFGLKSFESQHAELFFGRERIIKNIVEKLHQNNPLLIIGSSGSGKSSLLRAGLLPHLERDN